MARQAFAGAMPMFLSGENDVGQDKVRFLLSELNQELATAENLDQETLDLARKLEKDMELLIERSEPVSAELGNAIALEARFAATHPVAERILRELVAVLGRMGI
ncbi:DUF4404 family protein [Gammaproteobacteria bacterium LSUCC0112]|nr:DUF4404 family protein [Gammaproteobacteria bacterium LSUCC0112]